jgi:uncharacterized repeat protein (TIGR03803 family)
MSSLHPAKMTCILLSFCVGAAILSSAQTFSLLASFGSNDGSEANPSLVQAVNGNLYGTTYADAQFNGVGTIFEVTASGKLITLHKFITTDGASPNGGLLQASNGKLCGTTYYGGNGQGTFFRVAPGGAVTTLYTFCQLSACADGDGPRGLPIQGADGNLYGVTEAGGVSGGTSDVGTFFRITPSGTLTTLASFGSGFDPALYPVQILQATNGNFYGVSIGGSFDYASGEVFEITPAGQITTLYALCFVPNFGNECFGGYKPLSLIQAADGNLYGTTIYGGDYTGSVCPGVGCGTIFKITPSGTFTTLHIFIGTDGDGPNWLVQGTDGNFYGTTANGGALIGAPGCIIGCGTVFQMTPSGTLTTLHSFEFSEGDEPYGLMQATNGTFYGTTQAGGSDFSGTVYSLSMGLGPFVETIPTSGKVDATILILGNNLKGATNVRFNGVAAAFQVVSNTEIRASVPTGATTGTVAVVSPSGTLNSNVAFRVAP